MSAELITYGAALLIGVLVGGATCAVVYESRNEQAFTDRFRQRLASLFAEYRTADGGHGGVLVPFPDDLDSPTWARSVAGEHPDDEDPYPMDDDGEDQFPRNELRVTGGPWVRPAPTNSVALLNRQSPTWPASRGPGAHRANERLMSADTCQIGDDRVARALREAGR